MYTVSRRLSVAGLFKQDYTLADTQESAQDGTDGAYWACKHRVRQGKSTAKDASDVNGRGLAQSYSDCRKQNQEAVWGIFGC